MNSSAQSRLVKGVFFDLEGTLTHSRVTPASRAKACRQIGGFLVDNGLEVDSSTLEEVIREGLEVFEVWKRDHYRDIPPSRLWADMVFKTFDPVFRDHLRKVADQLSFLWETHGVQRRIRRGVDGVLADLKKRGFVLGLVSNVLHADRTRKYLSDKGFNQYFRVILLSQEVGYRKPHPVIFQEAARLAGIRPAEAVFIGDTLSRDISGAQKAGFGYTVLIPSELSSLKDRNAKEIVPDFTVPDLQRFPPLVEMLSRQGRLFGEIPPGS